MNLKKIFNLENLIYLIIFFLPIYLIKIKFSFFPTNILEIAIFFLGLLWFLGGRRKYKFKNIPAQSQKLLFSLGLIFFGVLSSAFFSGFQNVSLGIIKGWFIFPLIFLFLCFEIIEPQKIRKVFGAYFLSAAGVATISLIYLLLGKLTFDGRLEAFFNSPNYLAMYLAPSLIIFFLETENFKTKKFSLYLLGIILLSFYCTYSYTAWFSVIGALSVVSLARIKISLKQILIVAIILGALFLSQLNSRKMADFLANNPRSSLSSRVMIWKASFKMIEDNFLLGIGAGNFQKTYLEYQKFYPPYLEWAVPHPHNIFLAFWLYGGIVGLTGFLYLLFSYFQGIFREIKKENKNIFFVSLGIMLVILIHGIFDTTYFKNDLAIIFWLNFLVLL